MYMYELAFKTFFKIVVCYICLQQKFKLYSHSQQETHVCIPIVPEKKSLSPQNTNLESQIFIKCARDYVAEQTRGHLSTRDESPHLCTVVFHAMNQLTGNSDCALRAETGWRTEDEKIGQWFDGTIHNLSSMLTYNITRAHGSYQLLQWIRKQRPCKEDSRNQQNFLHLQKGHRGMTGQTD